MRQAPRRLWPETVRPEDRRPPPSVAARPRHSTLSLLALSLLAWSAALLAIALPPARAQPADATVRDVVDVTEARVTVSFPRLGKKAKRVTATDLLVREGEARRETTRLEPIDREAGAPWTVLIYFDLSLSRAATPATAARALARRAAGLAALGTVHTVLARERSLEPLPIARSAAELERNLIQIAGSERGNDSFRRLRLGARARDVLSGETLAQEARLLRLRADLLLTESAAVCQNGPCAQILVSDGFDLRTDLFHPRHAIEQWKLDSPADIALEVGRTLAATGWVSIPLPYREPRSERTASADSQPNQRGAGIDYDDWRDAVEQTRDGGRPSTNDQTPRGGREAAPPEALAAEAYVLPELEPLRDWATATRGHIARVAEQLDRALDELRARWWLYYRTERDPDTIEPLAVSFAPGSSYNRRALSRKLGFKPDREPLRTARWARAPYPEALDAARVRARAAGIGPLDGDRVLPVDADAVTVEAPLEKAQIRVSCLADDGSVTGRAVELRARNGRVRVPLEAAERASSCLLRDLRSGSWGWTVGLRP